MESEKRTLENGNSCPEMGFLLTKLRELQEKQGGGIVAIDGGSAAGKTTLTARLADEFGAAVYHMDDFFLRPRQRTQERLAQPGGNVDWERFLEEVLVPVTRREPVQLRRYDCHQQRLLAPVQLAPAALTVVEGAYSLHPALAPYYDYTVFLEVTPAVQQARLRRRNSPEQQRMFRECWIPLEQRYFTETAIRQRSDLVVPVFEEERV